MKHSGCHTLSAKTPFHSLEGAVGSLTLRPASRARRLQGSRLVMMIDNLLVACTSSKKERPQSFIFCLSCAASSCSPPSPVIPESTVVRTRVKASFLVAILAQARLLNGDLATRRRSCWSNANSAPSTTLHRRPRAPGGTGLELQATQASAWMPSSPYGFHHGHSRLAPREFGISKLSRASCNG